MRRFLDIARTVWAVCLLLLGMTVGATIGYANGGWIGMLCLGITGALIGGMFGAPGGFTLLLQLLRIAH